MILTHNSYFKQHHKLLMVLVMIILSSSLIYAFEFDNTKGDLIIDETTSEYGKIEIREWFGLKKLIDLELKTNSISCEGLNCKAIQEITIYEKGQLIQDIRFIENGRSINLKNHKFQIRQGVEEWRDYNYEEVASGTYELKLTGTINILQEVDWQVKTQGFWLTEWAIWRGDDGVISYYKLDEASGAVIDVKGISNMTNTGATPNVAGIIKTAYDFESGDAGDKLVVDEPITFGDEEFSMSLWINPESWDGGGVNRIWTGGTGPSDNTLNQVTGAFAFQLTTSGGVEIASWADTPEIGNWTHVVMTFNQTTQLLYVNATVVASVVNVGTISNSSIKDFGLRASGNDFLYDGRLDEIGFWNRSLSSDEVTDLYNNNLGLAFGSGESFLEVALTIPENTATTINTTIDFNATYTPTDLNLTNTTLFIFNSAGTLINQSTRTVLGNTTNASSLSVLLNPDIYTWNYEACGVNSTDDVSCAISLNNFTLTIDPIRQESVTFNSSTFETALQSYLINITFNSTFYSSISANFNYNGTVVSSTKSGSGDSAIFTTSQQVPLTPSQENKTFNWEFTLTNATGSNFFNSTNNTQEVNHINLSVCGISPQTVTYLNWSFTNETVAQEDVDASITQSSFTYSLGSLTLNKTLTFSDPVENLNYGFCFTPAHRTVNTEYSVGYTNSYSQQRIFAQQEFGLTNTSTLQQLFLLPTSEGLFTTFNTVDSVGNTITAVKGTITRTIGVTLKTISTGFTDGSGIIVYFLNPDFTYGALFTKSGLADNSFSFVPITTTRTVIMGTLAGDINGSTIGLNTTYIILPSNNSLPTDASIQFSFNVTSSQDINLISMNLTNSTNQITFQSNAGAGVISATINTANNTRIFGEFIYATGTETITVNRGWIIGNQFVGDYSLFRQMDLYLDYGFRDIFQYLIIIVTLIVLLIYLSSNETIDTSESKLMVVLLVLWIYSLVGWLQAPIVVDPSNTLGQFGQKHGLAILSTIAGTFFIFRRIFIRRI